jgi:hypothetical protein
VAEQCETTVFLTVTPPPLNFSDGTPMQVKESTRSANYGGNLKPPGYVPPGTFLVDVLGGPVGFCRNNKSLIKLSWTYKE